jgi:transcription initiation factor IIE alpha subunit
MVSGDKLYHVILTKQRARSSKRKVKRKKYKELKFRYVCLSSGEVNNGLLPSCNFETFMKEGSYNCPQCGHVLTLVSDGPSVAEILRKGLADERSSGNKK